MCSLSLNLWVLNTNSTHSPTSFNSTPARYALRIPIHKYQRIFFYLHRYTDTLHCMPWFQGDITTEEATYMLTGSIPGTFLIHMNKKNNNDDDINFTTINNNNASNNSNSNNHHNGTSQGFFNFGPQNGVVWACSVMGSDHTVHHLAISHHSFRFFILFKLTI